MESDDASEETGVIIEKDEKSWEKIKKSNDDNDFDQYPCSRITMVWNSGKLRLKQIPEL